MSSARWRATRSRSWSAIVTGSSSGREHGHRRREAVHEVTAPDRADLAGAEEAAGRRREGVLDRTGVVVGHVEHVGTATVAGEEQHAGGARRPHRLRLVAERGAEIL